MEVITVSPHDLNALRSRGQPVELIDVRTPVEYREMHIPFARNVPLSDLDPAVLTRSRTGADNEPMYFVCRSGNRGKQACEKLMAAGIAKVVNIEGGTLAWAACGLPVERGKKALSLERQVRIAAGLLVLLGTVLGWLVHPGFLGLAAFVGAGLVFAGVTDTCGMAMLLARMPWNRTGTKATTSAPQCAASSASVSVG